MRRVSLQTKILGLVLSLSVFLILLLSVNFIYMESKQMAKEKGHLALNTAKIVSFMPSVMDAFDTENPSEIIQPIVENIRAETGAEFIVVGNKEGIRYSHPLKSQIGKKMIGGDSERALQNGEYYVSEAQGSIGLSLRGKSPIFNEDGEIIGIVSVGFLVEDIQQQIVNVIFKELYIPLIAIIISIIASVILANNIRKDTLGLEPYEIANLYKEKNAVLQSVQEGILSIDKNGIITSMNQQAKKLLNITGSVRHLKVDELLPSGHLYDVLKSMEPQIDKEIIWKGKMIIVSSIPIFDDNGLSGVVTSFRDRTEIMKMVETLSEMKTYSEDLRAQTHEFSNKLYVLSGLLQLGEHEEAINMIQSETSVLEFQNKIVFEQIMDIRVQAILVGKLGKASEKKIKFEINSQSYLNKLPNHIKVSQLTLILGNIIDNAFEAVYDSENPTISFFTTDIGNDIIFEIMDNGKGILEEDMSLLFEHGFTTKSGDKPRGYGLLNADNVVKELGGIIEVHNGKENTVFTVYLPKEQKSEGKY